MMPYLLDANVFIQAKNLHYGMDFCPAFWDWLVQSNSAGDVFSIEKGGDELAAGADELSAWGSQRGERFFLRADSTILPSFGTVSNRVTAQGYEPAAVNGFLQVADYYLVAHALAHRLIVVPDEIPSPSLRRIKIPNACIGVGVSCITPYEMLRRSRARMLNFEEPGRPPRSPIERSIKAHAA